MNIDISMYAIVGVGHGLPVSLISMGGPTAGKTYSPGSQAWLDNPADAIIDSVNTSGNFWHASIPFQAYPDAPILVAMHSSYAGAFDFILSGQPSMGHSILMPATKKKVLSKAVAVVVFAQTENAIISLTDGNKIYSPANGEWFLNKPFNSSENMRSEVVPKDCYVSLTKVSSLKDAWVTTILVDDNFRLPTSYMILDAEGYWISWSYVRGCRMSLDRVMIPEYTMPRKVGDKRQKIKV